MARWTRARATRARAIGLAIAIVVAAARCVARSDAARDLSDGNRDARAPRAHARALRARAPAGASTATHREHLSTGISKELVDRVAVDGAVIVTWANMHYYDFALNFLSHLDALEVTNYLIGAMDEELYAALRKIGVNTWLMGSKSIDADAVKKDFGWGSKNFHKMGRDKIRLIHDFTKTGVDVLISDIDVAWLRNPIPFFRRYPKADILVSTDNLQNRTHQDARQISHMVDGEGLESTPCAGTVNIGMMWFRATEASQQLTGEWVRNLEKDEKIWDQAEFNTLVQRGGCGTPSPDGSGVGSAYEGKVQMGTLPVALFNNGHTYFTQRLPELINVNPYAMHATFQYDGTPGKRNRMREANQWLGDRDDPSYFDQKFLSYTPRVLSDVDLQEFAQRGYPSPDGAFETLKQGEHVVLEHMRLVQHQIAQLYEAVAIAKNLGRVVILPPFFCGLDRVWFPHAGRFPGSMLGLPFICPGDHVMGMESYGGDFMKEYREYAFLGHPHMPAGAVSADNVRRVEVPPTVSFSKTTLIPEEYGMCFHRRDPKTGAIVSPAGDACVPARNEVFRSAPSIKLTAAAESLDALAKSLESARDVKFLHFDTIIGATTSKQAENAKQIRMGIWCCRIGHHEYYGVENVTLFEEGVVDMKALEASTMNEGFAEKTNSSGMNVTVVSEDDPSGKDLENPDAKEEIKEADDAWEIEGKGLGEYRKSIEAGLSKYFDGDAASVKKAMAFIEESHAELNP